ncbi:MAG: lipoprotein insertase outer membrane protein LolB [Gammaproteobacteria bacterium]|nr:lipoprotein insertase outer membrane protein LolB [Gammaproteobacteria bacterium]
MISHLLHPHEAARLRVPALLVLTVILTSCASAPPALENSIWSLHQRQLTTLDSWQLQGRVNVRYDNESHTPRIRWNQQNIGYQINLFGTFNAGSTVIVGRPGLVTLEQGNEVLTASTAEVLILQQLGYELPVSNLSYWIKGLPSPEAERDLLFNELNQLIQIEQDGWTVNFTDYRQYGSIALPRRVELTRPRNDIRLRFVGLNWTLDASAN